MIISKVIAAEGEHKASRALRHAAEVIADSPAALQVRLISTERNTQTNRQTDRDTQTHRRTNRQTDTRHTTEVISNADSQAALQVLFLMACRQKQTQKHDMPKKLLTSYT